MLQRRALALLAICGSAFLAFLDTSIVNVSFPDIAASFPGASRAQLSWVLDAYFIAMAALLVPAGGLADRLGHKRVLLWGTSLFVITSIACAVAPNWQLLVGARSLQGVAAAIIAPVSLALLLPEFPSERRAAAVGIWGAAAALAAGSGPPLGGFLIEIADWRWIFLINIPIGLLIVAAGRAGLRESKDDNATGLPDLLGAGLSAAGLGVLALAIIEGDSWGWGSLDTVACFVAAAVLIGWLVRRCLVHPQPVVDPALMRIPSFAIANIGTMLFALAFFSMMLGNILFLTGVWQYSILNAGLAVLPGPLLTTVVAIPAGRIADRFGHRAVIVPGTIAYAIGLLVLRGGGAEPDFLGTWLPGQSLVGIGIGLAFPALGAAAVANVPADRYGSASAVGAAFRQFGAVLGTALLIAIVGSPTTLQAALDASDQAFILGIVAALAAGVTALALRPARVSSSVEEPMPVAKSAEV
ncbi:DHA2 family efflux MFS transporter permease subunit [Nocardia sp. GCM10030253]|uniref:DHA2 family efflux MFS transporter permease subunit n=1 Tax=Nocardia sp. GCM10030253 TaxID=3273404 RepID=UPI003626853B